MFPTKQSIFDRLNGQRFIYTKKCCCSDRDSKSQDDNAKKNKKQKSNNSKRCKVVSKLLIPEELMFEILSLLPVHCLLNSARYVCKPWATTIHNSLFAEACLHHACSKPGLYVEHTDSRSSYFLDIIDDVNDQFKLERTDLGTPPGMGRIVGSCDGILLLYYTCYGNRQHFIVNPILKRWLRIPPLSIPKYCEITLARVPHTTMFKLFITDIVEVSGAFWCIFYVLRIGIDNSLKEIARKEVPRGEKYLLQELLYGGGNDLCYITMEGIIVVDVDKDIIVGEYPLPPVKMYLGPIWLSMGDHLSCIVPKGFHDDETYEIYILDIDSRKWSLYHKMGPFNFAGARIPETRIENTAVRSWINDQIIIQVYIGIKEDRRAWKRNSSTSATYFSNMEERHKKKDIYTGGRSMHFSYNVKTRELKKIVGIAKEGEVRVWLHTNSLISLPSTSAH